jgi:hypothetical protein
MYHAGSRVRQSLMEGLTPASAADLPPLGELLVDDPFWQYPAWGLAREGAAHLRVWATAAASAGYLVGFHNPVMLSDLQRYGWAISVMRPVHIR